MQNELSKIVELDNKILELSITNLSEAFDEFIGACLDESGNPRQPTIQALMKAKAYLPTYCRNSFKR